MRRSPSAQRRVLAALLGLASALLAVSLAVARTSVVASQYNSAKTGAQRVDHPALPGFSTGGLISPSAHSLRLQQGVDGYIGCSDTRISSESPDANFGDKELVLGMKGEVGVLIRFDVSAIPSNALIEEAELSLYVSNIGQRPADAAICATYPVTRPWNEMQATWYKASDFNWWGLAGCNDITTDRSPVPTDQQAIYDFGRWYDWDVASAVQEWVRDAASNRGLLIQQTNIKVGGEYDIRESEYPGPETRPVLWVRYVLATPTPTSTSTPTATASPTSTSTPTSTPDATPTTIPATGDHVIYLPMVTKDFPLKCVQWAYTFQEEFQDSALNGWSVSLAGGQQQVRDSVIRLWTQQSMDRFPLVWRNDVFEGAGEDFELEARFRHSDFTAYGTTLAINSGPYAGSRIPSSQTLPSGIEDILSIHHVVDRTGGVYRFGVSMLRDAVVWNGTPGDQDWHVVRVTLEQGQFYTLYMDGQRVGSVRSSLQPRSVYIGNPTIQPFFGGWTQLHVDYIRISRCAEWGPY
jgi:hypothetical protein